MQNLWPRKVLMFPAELFQLRRREESSLDEELVKLCTCGPTMFSCFCSQKGTCSQSACDLHLSDMDGPMIFRHAAGQHYQHPLLEGEMSLQLQKSLQVQAARAEIGA